MHNILIRLAFKKTLKASEQDKKDIAPQREQWRDFQTTVAPGDAQGWLKSCGYIKSQSRNTSEPFQYGRFFVTSPAWP